MTELQGGYRIIDIEDGDIFETLKDVFANETKPLLVKGVNGTTDHFTTVSDLKVITDDNGETSEIDVPLGELSYNSSTKKHTQFIARVTPSSYTTEEVEVTSGSAEITYQQLEAACKPTIYNPDEVIIIDSIENIINNYNKIFSVNIGSLSKLVQVRDTDGNNMLSSNPTSTSYKYTYYFTSILRDNNFFTYSYSPNYLRTKILEKELTMLIYLAIGVSSKTYDIMYKFGNIDTLSGYTFYDSDATEIVSGKSYTINQLLAKDDDGTDTTHIYLPSNFNVGNWEFFYNISNSFISYNHRVNWDYIDPTRIIYNASINMSVTSLDDIFLTFTKVR